MDAGSRGNPTTCFVARPQHPVVNFPAIDLVNNINNRQRPMHQFYRWEMVFNLLRAVTGRKPRSLNHLPLTRRYAVQIADDNENLNPEGQRTSPWLQSLSWFTGSCKVCLLECLQGVILRNRKRHLEAARWHTDLVCKREKQADHIGVMAAAVLARAKDGNHEAP
jgi:hypothetical protein